MHGSSWKKTSLQLWPALAMFLSQGSQHCMSLISVLYIDVYQHDHYLSSFYFVSPEIHHGKG